MSGENGRPGKPFNADVLAGGESPPKVHDRRVFPVHSLNDILSEIRRAGGTGKLEINFKNGRARGDAKWRGFAKPE